MAKSKDTAKGESESGEEKRKKLLVEGAQPVRCPVCGSTQSRFRTKDQAIVCREGHTALMDGTVLLGNGVRTTMDELRKAGAIKERGEE